MFNKDNYIRNYTYVLSKYLCDKRDNEVGYLLYMLEQYIYGWLRPKKDETTYSSL
ncbi:hypothetical protein HCR_09690 [Hydrogenimonas cancrithermarum]|uniref:Uncharacterized protein n=1 Tax=Hydrogenimonas cancrithermarum TaxID=2993563 RepID=A0ABM8FLS7_9BACT|nr:hypothetical protein HCR_09690 [Hydrogenimonas cancrithermarum]